MIDGGDTRDGSGRALKKLVWEQVGGNDVALGAAITQANSQNNEKGSPRLVIPGASFDELAADPYTVRLTATNFLDVSTSSASFTFTKTASAAAPLVAVLGGAAQTFSIAKGISVSTQLLASSVCPGSEVGQSKLASCNHTAQRCMNATSCPPFLTQGRGESTAPWTDTSPVCD